MKRIIFIIILSLSLFLVNSQETVDNYFTKPMRLSPEQFKELKEKFKTDVSYDFVKYKIVNENLFSKISDISIKSIKKELSKRESYKGGVSISYLKMYIIKVKGIIYFCVTYNPYSRLKYPLYSMPQPAGFTIYKGITYELIFGDSIPTLFTPTKEIKTVVEKKDDIYVHFESAEIYLQIKGHDVKEINRDTLIK